MEERAKCGPKSGASVNPYILATYDDALITARPSVNTVNTKATIGSRV